MTDRTPPPESNVPIADTIGALVNIAREHREAGEFREAMSILDFAKRLWPRDGRVRHQIGLALFWSGDPNGLQPLIEAVLEDTGKVDRLADLAECLSVVGHGSAMQWFRKALVQAPDLGDLLVRFGQFLSRLGRLMEAEAWIRRSLGVKHPFGHGHVALSDVQKRNGHLAEAIATLSRGIDADPEHTMAYVALYRALLGAGASIDQAMAPGRIVAERMPERMEAVIPVVSYLRDVGAEEEAVRLCSGFLSKQWESGERDDFGKHGIRVLHPDHLLDRLELVIQLDLHLKMKMLGWLPPFVSVLIAPKGRVVNATMLDYYRPFITVVDDPKLIEMMEPLKNRVPFNPAWVQLPDGRGLSKARAYYVVSEEWRRQGRSALMQLTQAHTERGKAELRRMGVPAEAWYVCVHVREPGYTNEGANSPESARNANIALYLAAIEEVTRQGGWVIRIGDASMTPLKPMKRVVDYAVSPFKSDWMDVFLMASCRFMLGTSSGPVVVAEVFGVPVGAADFFPSGTLLHTPKDVIIPRPYRERATGRMLSFEEMLRMPYAFTYDSNALAAHGIDAVPSEAEDIHDLAIEMLERTEGKWPYDAEDERLNARWFELYEPISFGTMGCRIGRGFLRRHRHLFQTL